MPANRECVLTTSRPPRCHNGSLEQTIHAISAHHFGERVPRDLDDIPAEYDPFELSVDEYEELDQHVRAALYLGVRQLNWAGTTWTGVNFYDDSRCVDYLISRRVIHARSRRCTHRPLSPASNF